MTVKEKYVVHTTKDGTTETWREQVTSVADEGSGGNDGEEDV